MSAHFWLGIVLMKETILREQVLYENMEVEDGLNHSKHHIRYR